MPIESACRHRKELRLTTGHERLLTFKASSRRVADRWLSLLRCDTISQRREFLRTFDVSRGFNIAG